MREKRALAALLALVMVVGLLPVGALAAPGDTAETASTGSVVGTAYSSDPDAYEIYPVPHSVTYPVGEFTLDTDVNVVVGDGVDSYTTDFVREILTRFGHTMTTSAAVVSGKSNIVLAIDSTMTESEGRYDPYTLTAQDGTITITGMDTDCVYYGVATLQMMFTSFNGKKFLNVQIADYSNTVFRGFIEGFYGGFNYDQRESQVRSIRDVKGNMYVFASKTDSYHGGADWANEYPEAEAKQIEDLVAVCEAMKVKYTWSLHIGKAGVLGANGTTPSDTEYAQQLKKVTDKFNSLYAIGVRSFQILNDDANSGSNEACVRLLNDVNSWIKGKGDCMPLIYCCKGYNTGWALGGYGSNGTEMTVLQDLDDDIYLYWTGSDVNTPITQENIDWPNTRSGHSVVTWLNYPCSEHCGKRGVFLGDISYYVKDADGLTGQAGLLSNPMDWAEANKVAYFQLLSWAWNRDNYTSYLTDLWEDSFKYLQPEVAGAYLTIARNLSNCPGSGRVSGGFPESEYIRDRLEAVQAKAVAGTDLTTDTDVQALLTELDNIQAAVTAFEANCANDTLKDELELWLDSLEYVTVAAQEALLAVRCLNVAAPDNSEVWNHFSAGAVALGQWDALKDRKQAGSLRLRPFATALLDRARGAMAEVMNPGGGLGGQSFYAKLHGVVRTDDTNSAKIFDGNPTTFASYQDGTANQQQAGDYYGVDLGSVKLVSAVDILQGQSDTEENYFHKATLECSTDGENWTTLVTKVNSHHILVEGLNVAARYVRLRLLEKGYGSKLDYWTRIREFSVTTEAAGVYTNVSDPGAAQVTADGGIYTLAVPSLTLVAGEYVGIRLPQIMGVRTINTAGTLPAGVKVQYSVSGESWVDNPPAQTTRMGYVRLYNGGSAAATITDVTLIAAEPVRTQLSFVSANPASVGNGGSGSWADVVDGDRSTQVYIGQKQVYGHYAIFDLGARQPVHDITVWIPDSGDDVPHNLDVFISDTPDPDSGWTLLAELRDNHYDMDVPYRYFSCDGEGAVGRYLKLAIANVDSRNWYYINELEVNRTVAQEERQTAVSASSGTAQYAADGDLLTFFTPEAGAGYWEKLLQAPTALTAITVLRGEEGAGATVKVQQNGSWTDIGSLTGTATTIDLTAQGAVTGVRLEWTAGNEPSIAEVILAGEGATGGTAPTLLPNLYEKPADPAGITVENGTALADVGLPAQVSGSLSDDTIGQVDVVWTCPDYDPATAGDYIFTGTFQTDTVANPGCFTLFTTVTVRSAEGGEEENLALDRPVYVSGVEVDKSTENNATQPEKAVDGKDGTRWSGNIMKGGTAVNGSNHSWIVVDLGTGVQSISSISMDYYNLVWPASYVVQAAGSDYTPADFSDTNVGTIAATNDAFAGQHAKGASCWTTIKTYTDRSVDPHPTDTVTQAELSAVTLPQNTRYIRLYFTKINSVAGGNSIGLRELTVNGTRGDAPVPEEPIEGAWNLALEQPTAASGHDGASTSDKAVDGFPTDSHQWSSANMKDADTLAANGGNQKPQWLWVDLGYTGSQINQIKLWYNMKVWPMVYEIQTTDGDPAAESTVWDTVVRVERSPFDGAVKNGAGQNIADETGNTVPSSAANTDTITTTSVPSLQTTTLKRYVRVYIEKVNTLAPGNNTGIRELEIYGTNPNRHPAVDVDAVLASATNATVSVNGATVTLPAAPAGATLTVAGSSLENVVAGGGAISQKNIGAREVKLLVRAWDNQNPDNYQQKNLTVTVPDHKSTYPAAWFPSVSGGNAKPEVIPAIQEWYGYTGNFNLSESSRIVINDAANVGLQKVAQNMKADLKEISGLDLTVTTGTSGGANDIYIEAQTADSYDLGKEGYLMRVSDEGIKIYAPTYTGCIFGTITVEQILWQAADRLSVPKGIMRDYPAYEVRGVKLDIGRAPTRYQQLQDVAKIMLWYKISEYDLHINDTENPNASNATDVKNNIGFHRLESSTFPSLKLMDGVKRAGVNPDLVDADYYNDPNGYGGNPVYTKQQWKDLAQLCKDYGMNLLTEIDMPGHALAYNKYVEAYPEEAAAAGITGPIRSTDTSNFKAIELLDLTGANAENALKFAKALWDEYTSDGTITGKVVHIGADEYWLDSTEVKNAFARFADELRKVVQANLGEDTKIRMWGEGTAKFSTATTALGKTHKELAEDYELEIWATGYDNPVQRAKEGYKLVNCEQSAMYSCPGRYGRDVPNAEYLFNSWDPTVFGGSHLLYGDPNLLGAKAVMWGEQTQEGLTERDVNQRILRAVAIMSEKTWTGKQQSEGTFAEYEMRFNRLAEGPGTHIAMNVDSETSLVLDYDFKNLSTSGTTVYDQSGNGYNGTLNAAGTVDANGFLSFNGSTLLTTDLTTLSYPYTVSFDLKADAGNTKESSLFSGYDGRIQVAGHNGKLSANACSFIRDFNYTVPTNGTAVNITIVGTQQATRLYVNGQLITFLSQTEDKDGVAAGAITSYFSSVPLPLEKIGQGLHGAMANLKVYNKAMTAAEVAAVYAGTDDGLVNVAQNAVVGGSSYHTGDGYDNGVQRTAVAQKAVDGEEEEMYSYWRADHNDSALTVDLGQSRSISQVVARWSGTAPGYTIQTSTNGTTWNNFTSGTAVSARYVKVNANGAGNLQELLVYEQVDKTDLADMLEQAEALVESKGAGFESTGEDAALFAAVVFARAVQNSPLATKADVAKAVEGLESYGDGPEPSAFTVTVSGTARVGQRLTATLDPANATATYQWFRVANGVETAISGATGPQYTLTAEDVGKTVFVKATGTDNFFGTVSSAPTATVTEAPTPPVDPVTPNKPSGDASADTPKDEKREDGATVTVAYNPDGSRTETVEQTDGTKSETVTARNGDKTITVTDEDGEELAKVELPARLPVSETEFVDVPADHWAKESINKMKGLGLVNGVGGGLYDAGSPVTRGALATVLHRLSNGKTDYRVTFADVRGNKYYTQGVAWAAKAKVVTGYTADIFAPDDTITREQLAVMMVRYAKLIGMDTTADPKALDKFADGEKTGAWAVDGVAWCVEKGILKGKGVDGLDPTTEVSRAEVAVMLDRFIALIK